MSTDYFTLMASLPNLPTHFDVDRVPISRARLEERLRMVEGDDLKDLEQLSHFISWDRQPINKSDSEVVKDYQRIQNEARHPIVKFIVQHRIDARTLVGALRRRDHGLDPPASGIGDLAITIRRNWKEPFFGLQVRFPWIEEFYEKMKKGEAVAAERILFEWNWQAWSRMASEYTFCFESILLYVAKWAVIERWTSQSEKVGLERFEDLVEEALGSYAQQQF